jgi:hypothetical protein
MRLYEEFGLSVSDDTIYRALKKLGFSHMSARPKAYKQNAEAMEAFKKEIRTTLAPGTPFRGLVPRRDAGGSKEQAHPSLGQERFTPPCCPRSTDPIDLSVRCGLPRTWSWRRPRAAGLQLRSHAAPSRRDPPRAPELNGQENIWQFMRQNWLSNRIFKSSDDIVDHCCYAWNTPIDQPWKIMSIAQRDWAAVGHSI